MNLRIGFRSFVVTGLLAVAPLAFAASKLKGAYSGSGGIAAEVHRVVMVAFATDSTALVQQNSEGKDPQTWHAHWTQQDKVVTVTFDAVKDKPAMEPLVMKINHGTLVPTTWDAAVLGLLGPPKLMPFSGKNIQTGTLGGCTAIVNSKNPADGCVTWDSRK